MPASTFSRISIGAAALLLGGGAWVLAQPPASPSAPPLIAYEQTGDRGLVMINNPEYILDQYLADQGKAIHREDLAAGAWRFWSSHHNQTPSAVRQLVWLHNPGKTPTTVRIQAAGHGDRGQEFLRAFNSNDEPRQATLAPGQSLLLHATPAVKKGGFFGAVIDWTADQPLHLISAIAKPDFDANADPTALQSVGYVTTTILNGRHREARVYKGSNPNSVAELSLQWTIDDQTDPGVLPVRVRRFDARTGYGDPQMSHKGWLTNICIGHREQATMSDMFTFTDPSYERPIDPAKPSDALDMFPNVGNWGVVYRHHGRIINAGKRDRRLAFRLIGKGLHLAVQTKPDGDWQKVSKAEADWLVLDLPAGATTTFDARLVLGGPANGAIWHQAVLLD